MGSGLHFKRSREEVGWGRGGSKELRGYCNDSGDNSWCLESEKWLYLGSVMETASTEFFAQMCKKENSEDSSWVHGIKANVLTDVWKVFSDLAPLPL